MPDLVALRREMEEARKLYEFWAMTNTAGQTPETLVKIDLGYRKAEMQLMNAQARYYAALQRAANA